MLQTELPNGHLRMTPTRRRVVGPGLWRWRPKDLSGYMKPASDMPALAPDPKSTEMASSVPAGRGRGQTGVAARVWFDCARRQTTTKDLWSQGGQGKRADCRRDGQTALALRQHLSIPGRGCPKKMPPGCAVSVQCECVRSWQGSPSGADISLGARLGGVS
jgi:hypothetical protein